MTIRDRIREFRRVPAGQLRPNPKNWRKHPQAQHDALRGVLAEIGYADALLARELPDGSLELVDGHLRAEVTPDMSVPVLVLDLTEAEADLLLAVLDPLAGLATTDSQMLGELMSGIETNNAAVRSLLDRAAGVGPNEAAADPAIELPSVEIPEAYQIVVECRDEEQQRELYQQLRKEGFICRVLSL